MKPKKLLSFLLATAMTISLLPTFTITVSAEEYTGTLDEDTGLYYTKYDDHCKITGCAVGTASFSIPETIENLPVTSIEKGAFALNTLYLTSVTISNSVTSIGEGAFYGCTRLTSITIPDSVTSISDNAFHNCKKLTSITIGNCVTSIEDSAFGNTGYYNDSSKWENGVLYIGNYLIKANEEISGNINIKDGTKLICENAFERCGYLTGVTIPDSVTSIGDGAFYSCGELTSIKLPKGITTISNSMFKKCKGLTSLDIPNSVTSIGYSAFSGCDSLNCINYDGTKKEWKAITIDSTNELTNVEINYLREPKTTTTVSGKIFTVTGKNIDGYTVILALYKDDGQGNSQLVDCKTAVYSGTPIPFTTTATDYTSAKVMVWKNLSDIEPVTEVEIVDLK